MKLKRILFRIVIFVTLLLLFASTSCYLLQRRFLHHPAHQSSADLHVVAAGIVGQPWPSLEEYRGVLFEPKTKQPKGTVLVFHGNSGAATDRGFYAEALVPLGYRVILLEHPGYGPRRGPLDEKTLVDDGVQSVQLAIKEFGEPVYIFGESLGAGVAAAVVGKAPEQVAGLMLITPWDSLPHLVEARAWSLPIGWLVRDKYDSVANLRHYPGPLLVVEAGKDEVIPRACTVRLYDSFPGQKKLEEIDVAGHIGWQKGCDENWWGETMAFLGKL